MKFNKAILDMYLVAGTQNVHGNIDSFLSQLEAACRHGITAFQYREKGPSALSGTRKLEIGRLAHDITQKYHVPFIVDDDIELANQLNADGLHVGQNDTDISQILQDAHNMFVGLSINTKDELHDAQNVSGIAYLGIGPIFSTQSKRDAAPAIGIQNLHQLSQATGLPTVAIGGINEHNVQSVRQAPIDGVAVISAIMNSSNVAATIYQLKGKSLL